MLSINYQPEKENIKIRGEASDLMALHSTVRKVMLEAASYEQEHHEVSDFLVGFLEKLETAYSGISQPGKTLCRACSPFSDHITLRHEELIVLGTLLNCIGQYADMDQQDQACLLLIDSFIAALQASVAEDKCDCSDYLQKPQSFRNIKTFVASFREIPDDFFSKYQYDER
jgi:hypothetical protein